MGQQSAPAPTPYIVQWIADRVLLGLGYCCGLRGSEVIRLKVKHIDRAQNIIRSQSR